MIAVNPLIKTDFYKVHHNQMYPQNTTLIYSNLTPRKSRLEGIKHIVWFSLQNFLLELQEDFHHNFFSQPWPKLQVEYERHIPVNTDHIKRLHKLGYLPLEIKSLPEGSLVPIGVPTMTIHNTRPEFYWLVNYLETIISCSTWQGVTSATIAREFRQKLNQWALETTGSMAGVEWQAHDFSMRGMSSVDSAVYSGMGHLLSFQGTDTIPAIYQLEAAYAGEGLIGASVPATEHSVMCMGEKESEIKTFERLLKTYPEGILSVVSDTWDLWKVCTEILPALKDQIMGRDGKLVIRPDSGNPVDILCGTVKVFDTDYITGMDADETTWLVKGKYMRRALNPSGSGKAVEVEATPAEIGVVELLWNVFGGTINEKGYKVLDSHIGAIYGDSITRERAEEICRRLAAKGFASTNVVLGIGSYTYQYNTRDTFGFAVKATYGEVLQPVPLPATATHGALRPVGREIFKDPITDDGTKRSAKGLLAVRVVDGEYKLFDQVSWEEMENNSELQTVWKNSSFERFQTLVEIRERVATGKRGW